MDSRRSLIQRVVDFNAGREPERLALKYKAMQKDPLAFFRGSCYVFAEDWPQNRHLDRCPTTWVCGDLHNHVEFVGRAESILACRHAGDRSRSHTGSFQLPKGV
jgi:uncharacterized protein (DUF2252 family)